MNTKHLILTCFALLLLLSGCSSDQEPPSIPTATQADASSTSDQGLPLIPSATHADAVSTQSGTTSLLTLVDEGYFLRIPAEYHVVKYGDSMCLSLYQGHEPPGPCHSASLIVDVTNAEGRTAVDEADRLVAWAVGAIPDITVQRSSISIAANEAVMLQGLPGVSSSRVVVINHQDRLYTLTFMPWDPDGGEDFRRLEELFSTVTASLGFLGNW